VGRTGVLRAASRKWSERTVFGFRHVRLFNKRCALFGLTHAYIFAAAPDSGLSSMALRKVLTL
jgi:hypothetical protein